VAGMISALKDAFQAAETWPEEDQEALVEAAREIEASTNGRISRDGRGACCDRSGARWRATRALCVGWSCCCG